VTTPDTHFTARAQALPAEAAETRVFIRNLTGAAFSGDSVREAIVTDQFLEAAGIDAADSAVGMRITVTARLASIDSGLTAVLRDEGGVVRERILDTRLDSLRDPEYRQRVFRRELNAAMDRFMTGFLERKITRTESLTIRGVVEAVRGRRINIEPVVIPADIARRLTSGGISSDPDDLISAFTRGDLFRERDESIQEYPSVTLILDPRASHAAIRDSVEAAGFRAFSFAEQYDQIRKFFVYFDLFLGIIGAIALVTASLGIINTMIMSIVERTREIGVLKALGAGDRDIGLLFLIESGSIGTIGSILGIVAGWIATRIASLVAQSVMQNMEIDPVEMFAIPVWLIVTAFVFGLAVSILAGSLPARRAARIDPVIALRAE
jgi:putative ABC transport system permease protein